MVIATITMETLIKVVNVLAHNNHYHGKHFQGNPYFGTQKPVSRKHYYGKTQITSEMVSTFQS